MHHDYWDIRRRIPNSPLWWDEHAVPRYDDFKPGRCADIYAHEVVLLLVTCQSCGKEYPVCLSRSSISQMADLGAGSSSDPREDTKAVERVFTDTLARRIQECAIDFGDPPNACDDNCAAGATMSSEPRRVLQYWRRDRSTGFEWWRDPALEIDVAPEWVTDREGVLERLRDPDAGLR